MTTGWNIRVSTPDGNFADSNGAGTEFAVDVKCGSTLNYVVTHSPALPETLQHPVPDPPDEPIYAVSAFNYQQPLCKAIKYEFLNAKVAGVLPTGLTTKTTPDGTVDATLTPSTNIYATNYGLIMKYPFYLKLTLEGGQEFWAINDLGTELHHLDVICGPTSTKITETNTYCCGHGDIQYWPKAVGNCFVLPGYTNSNPSCPINTNTTSLNPTPPPNIVGIGLNDPVWDAGLNSYKVCPQDFTVDKFYEFYIY